MITIYLITIENGNAYAVDKKTLEVHKMARIIFTSGRNWYRPVSLVAALLTLFLLLGCAGGNYGKLERNRDLDNMFLNYEVLPDHRYYTTGGYDAPNAILAIHRDYELDNQGNLWVGIPNISSEQIRKWVDTISPEQDYRYGGAYFASYILNLDGQKIGAWYSYETFTTIKFLDDNRIQVYTPPLNKNMEFNGGEVIRQIMR